MSTIIIEGYLGAKFNDDFLTATTNEHTVRISVTNENDIKKLENIMNNYTKGTTFPIVHINGTYEVTIKVKNLAQKVGPKMMKSLTGTTRQIAWVDKNYSLSIELKSYKFKSKYSYNSGETIKGVHFNLIKIDQI